MSKPFKTWIYHKTEEPKIIDSDKFDEHEKDGWKDSPMYFIKTTDFGVNPKDTVKVQCLGESIEGVKNCVNGMLNLESMTMKELKEFASLNFGGIKARSKKSMIEKIEAANGNSSGHN